MLLKCELYNRLRTSVQTFIARWSAATLDPVWVVTQNLDGFVHLPVRTDVVGGPVPVAVPVLDTAVGVRIPTTRLAGAVQVVAAVNYWARGRSDAVVTAGITDWPLTTIGVLLVVAAVCEIYVEAGCVSVRNYRRPCRTSPGCRPRRRDR